MKPSFFISRLRKQKAKNPINIKELGLDDAYPKNFDAQKIKELLQDLGRQTLHTLVTECVEQLFHWRQVNQTLKSHGQEEAFAKGFSVYLAWKHRIQILEMIAEAQSSIQHESLIQKPGSRPILFKN